MSPWRRERREVPSYTCLLGTQKKATDPSGTGRKAALAPSLQLISNYVSESLGTAGEEEDKKHKENKNKIFHQLPGISQGFMENQWKLKEKFDLALLWIWHQDSCKIFNKQDYF